MPMRNLAIHLHRDASNLTGIADRLESQGLVQRQVDPADRRIKRLVLTEQGARTADELWNATVSGSDIIALPKPIKTALLARVSEDHGVRAAL